MRTIGEAAKERAKENYFYEGSNNFNIDMNTFIAGVELAQRWIPVEEEIYPSHTQVLVKTKEGSVYDVVHNSHDDKVTSWWGSGRFEIYKDEIVSWRPIERF